jgi:hypothetical protein
VLELALSEARAAAGAVVHGRALAADAAVAPAVELVRVEQSPSGTAIYRVAGAETSDDGTFELSIPDGAPPGFQGRECSLRYALRATAGGDELVEAFSVDGLIAPSLPEQLDPAERAALSERFVASFPGRRMHLELVHPDLRGGGRIGGRAHVDRAPARGRLVASIRCLESWRVAPGPGRWMLQGRANGISMWRHETWFESSQELEPLDADNWRGFSFDLPEWLPPAVEARSIAWRYEVEVRRSVRFGPDERAVLTPLGFVDVSGVASARANRSIRTSAHNQPRPP